ncbi:phosphatase PAP2 family protein [Paramicrobacterium fandaimingii]|uniref:phosphatase PAP2 family protein n=1 Tax=Paramicrobacterium fandaimingii TaxID=2708079 RepID=UPI00141E1952|nr:phosphatase PAP2 family protein [Microbacterium fandaimingii]
MLTADARYKRYSHLRRAGGWSIASTVAFVMVFVAAVLTPVGQYTDAFSFGVFDWLPPLADLLLLRTRALTPYVLCAAAVVLGVVGARRGLLLEAAVGTCAIIGAFAASSILKYSLLERPYFGDFGYTVNTYPSGHVAVSTLAAIMIVRMLPGSRVRAIVLCLVVAAVTAIGIASVTTMAHRPSDVLGGLALAGVIAPWAARMRVASLSRFGSVAHGPGGAVAAIAVALTALAPLAGADVGTIAVFSTATLATTWLVIWVATASPATPLRPQRGKQKPEA